MEVERLMQIKPDLSRALFFLIMKISFCTTCMGRLHHLEQTLPINLINTASYPNREFILLNYGSKDDLHNWVKKHLTEYIEAGIVKYYRTKIPKYFVATHAKNIAHRQATGDILCNVDSDNFLLQGFAEHIVEQINESSCIIASPSYDMFDTPGSCGKIALKREHFYSVNGYDEDINQGWGWDDTNFQMRARLQNNLKLKNFGKKWCICINHSDCERIKNFVNHNLVFTKEKSIEITKKAYENKNYIVNQNKNWGIISDLTLNKL